MKTIIENVRFLQKGTMCFGDLYMEDGFIERIDYKTPKPLSDLAVNGFIDLHTHGFRGFTCEETDPKALQQLAEEYAKRGIVGFTATLNPMSFAAYEEIFQAYREAFQGEYYGARFYGIHMEGPYLNPLEANDLDPAALKQIDTMQLEEFLMRNHDLIKVMSIAPELPRGMEAVRMLHRYGIQTSFAHTRSDYKTAQMAMMHGMALATHLCNAMPDLDHHQPGIVDAILNASCLCELNMDGVHIQKPMLQWLIRLLGPDRIVAISDGSSFSGFEYPDGYQLDSCHVVKNNAIYCHDHLSSSFRDLLDAFQYLYKELEYSLEDCMKMTSINAGKLLHSMNYEIALGKRVDLIIVDHNMELKDVIIHGRHSF